MDAESKISAESQDPSDNLSSKPRVDEIYTQEICLMGVFNFISPKSSSDLDGDACRNCQSNDVLGGKKDTKFVNVLYTGTASFTERYLAPRFSKSVLLPRQIL